MTNAIAMKANDAIFVIFVDVKARKCPISGAVDMMSICVAMLACCGCKIINTTVAIVMVMNIS